MAQIKSVDGIGCIVGQGRAVDSGGQADGGAAVSAQAGSRAQAHGGAASLLGHRLCSALRRSVEGIASGVRLGERGLFVDAGQLALLMRRLGPFVFGRSCV